MRQRPTCLGLCFKLMAHLTHWGLLGEELPNPSPPTPTATQTGSTLPELQAEFLLKACGYCFCLFPLSCDDTNSRYRGSDTCVLTWRAYTIHSLSLASKGCKRKKNPKSLSINSKHTVFSLTPHQHTPATWVKSNCRQQLLLLQHLFSWDHPGVCFISQRPKPWRVLSWNKPGTGLYLPDDLDHIEIIVQNLLEKCFLSHSWDLGI